MSRTPRTTRMFRTPSTPGGAARLAAALLGGALALVVLAGCGGSAAGPVQPGAAEAPAAAFPVSITDDASRSVTVDAEPQRIVSLAPANTEIAFALGLGDRVVGVTTFDDYPAEVADIERVGRVTGTTEKAASVVGVMKLDVEAVRSAVEAVPPVSAFVEIAQSPLYTVGAGTLIDELVGLAGGTNIVTEPGYVAYSSEQLIQADPEVYLATKGSMSDPAALAKRAGYGGLSAVKAGRVYVLDDNLVSRPGPRVAEGLKQIAAALHPDAFVGK